MDIANSCAAVVGTKSAKGDRFCRIKQSWVAEIDLKRVEGNAGDRLRSADGRLVTVEDPVRRGANFLIGKRFQRHFGADPGRIAEGNRNNRSAGCSHGRELIS